MKPPLSLLLKLVAAGAVSFLALILLLGCAPPPKPDLNLNVVNADQPPAAAGPAPAPARPAEPRESHPHHQFEPVPEGWSPLAVAPSPAVETADRPIPLTGVVHTQENLTGYVVSPACRRAALTYDARAADDKLSCRLIVCDLAAGTVLTNLTLPGSYTALALSPDGRQLVVRGADRRGPKPGWRDPVWVWTLAAGAAPAARPLPVDRDDTYEANHWAEFCAGGKLAVQVGRACLAVYDAATLRPEYWVQTDPWATHAVTRDGRYLAFLDLERRLCVLDVPAGRLVATRTVKENRESRGAAVAFSPSGRRLAWCDGGFHRAVFDTATGRPLEQVSRKEAGGGYALIFPDEDYFLCGGELFHATESWVVWTYHGIAALPQALAVRPVGSTWWAVSHEFPGHRAALVPLRLPHAPARAAAQALQVRGDFYALGPGTPVHVDVEGIPDAPQREPIRRTLTSKLAALGCPVRADAEVILYAAVKRYGATSFHYSGPGGTLRGEYRPTTQVVQLARHDRPVWRHERRNLHHLPGSIVIREGETVKDWVEWFERPDYKYFDAVDLPRIVTAQTWAANEGHRLGVSVVTPGGLVDQR